MKRPFNLGAAALCIVGMTIVVTWPQAIHMTTHVTSHQDPEFSIWRLGWMAHALATDPRHLLAGNIFYPSTNTLTYSDAMLLQGVLAAPLFSLKLPPILIYNLVLLTGIAGSGLGAYVLARELTGRAVPALFAAAVFTMAPYRVEHYMHLELQWAMWIPLTFWAIHITLNSEGAERRRYGVLTGIFFWLQIMSCVYYGVFLAIAVAAYATALAVLDGRRLLRALPALAAGGVLAATLTAPYLWAYISTARTMGPRETWEIGLYSARLWSYFASPPQNLIWGWTSSAPEVNLMLGATVIGLSVCGALLYRSSRDRLAYAVIALTAVVFSFGLNTPVYRLFIALVPGLRGLRSPSRFGIVTCCAFAVLSAFGIDVVQQRTARAGGRWARYAVPALFALLFLEYANTGMLLMDLSMLREGTVYKVMKSAGPGVVVELPMPTAGTLPGNDTEYEMWSLAHWHPLVNGYSGYYPPDYIETLGRMETFPDDESIARLKRLDVRYVVVHCKFYAVDATRDDCPGFLSRVGERAELHSYGKYTDPLGAPAYLFVFDR